MLRDTSAASTSNRSTASACATGMPASQGGSVMMAAVFFITTHPSRFNGSISCPAMPEKGHAGPAFRRGGGSNADRARPSDDRDRATRNQGDHPRDRRLGGGPAEKKKRFNAEDAEGTQRTRRRCDGAKRQKILLGFRRLLGALRP